MRREEIEDWSLTYWHYQPYCHGIDYGRGMDWVCSRLSDRKSLWHKRGVSAYGGRGGWSRYDSAEWWIVEMERKETVRSQGDWTVKIVERIPATDKERVENALYSFGLPISKKAQIRLKTTS